MLRAEAEAEAVAEGQMAILISAAEVITGEEQEEESNVSNVEALTLPMPAPITSGDVLCFFSRNKV